MKKIIRNAVLLFGLLISENVLAMEGAFEERHIAIQ
jgi:hypothetical protein